MHDNDADNGMYLIYLVSVYCTFSSCVQQNQIVLCELHRCCVTVFGKLKCHYKETEERHNIFELGEARG
jgi:hypothetical protein